MKDSTDSTALPHTAARAQLEHDLQETIKLLLESGGVETYRAGIGGKLGRDLIMKRLDESGWAWIGRR